MENRRNRALESNDGKDFVDFLNSLWAQVHSPDFKRLGITTQTIIAQAMNFFLGGFETSSTVLTHLLWYMANNPDIQSKMHQEVKKFGDLDAKTILGYEDVKESKIPYITASINEALRLGSPLFRYENTCKIGTYLVRYIICPMIFSALKNDYSIKYTALF